MPTENNWRGCNKCSVVFFNGFPDKGTCVGGPGGHVAQSFNFQLSFNVPETATAQANWRGCDRCSGLFFAGTGGPPAPNCPGPGDGTHFAQSENFVLRHDVQGTPIDQPGWAFCGLCRCMFFNGFADKGHCRGANGGGHVMPAGSFAFVLAHWITPRISLSDEPDANGITGVVADCSGFSPLNKIDLQWTYSLDVAGTAPLAQGPAPTVLSDNDGSAIAPITLSGSELPADAFNIVVEGTDEATATTVASNVLRPRV